MNGGFLFLLEKNLCCHNTFSECSRAWYNQHQEEEPLLTAPHMTYIYLESSKLVFKILMFPLDLFIVDTLDDTDTFCQYRVSSILLGRYYSIPFLLQNASFRIKKIIKPWSFSTSTFKRFFYRIVITTSWNYIIVVSHCLMLHKMH